MNLLAEYRRRAVDLERLAREAITEEHRHSITDIAATWRMLAEQRVRLELVQHEEARARAPNAAAGEGN